MHIHVVILLHEMIKRLYRDFNPFTKWWAFTIESNNVHTILTINVGGVAPMGINGIITTFIIYSTNNAYRIQWDHNVEKVVLHLD